jgi:hypothetical protein
LYFNTVKLSTSLILQEWKTAKISPLILQEGKTDKISGPQIIQEGKPLKFALNYAKIRHQTVVFIETTTEIPECGD